jgi:CheY-like chemotaxis protein
MGETPGMAGANHENPTYTILIVVDSAKVVDVLRATLDRMNLSVFHVVRGNEALELYDAHHPDLILLDVALPDMPGWKLLDIIRERQRGEKDPIIIMITAYGDPANRLMGKLQGVFDYLSASATPDQIEQVVRQALRLS